MNHTYKLLLKYGTMYILILLILKKANGFGEYPKKIFHIPMIKKPDHGKVHIIIPEHLCESLQKLIQFYHNNNKHGNHTIHYRNRIYHKFRCISVFSDIFYT